MPPRPSSRSRRYRSARLVATCAAASVIVDQEVSPSYGALRSWASEGSPPALDPIFSSMRLGSTELHRRAERALAALADCRACPRDCGVNRLEDKWAACKTGRYAVVSSCFPPFCEEDCLRGWNGSGTIFFAHCNLRCVFCQNFDISQDIKPASERGS